MLNILIVVDTFLEVSHFNWFIYFIFRGDISSFLFSMSFMRLSDWQWIMNFYFWCLNWTVAPFLLRRVWFGFIEDQWPHQSHGREGKCMENIGREVYMQCRLCQWMLLPVLEHTRFTAAERTKKFWAGFHSALWTLCKRTADTSGVNQGEAFIDPRSSCRPHKTTWV